MVIFHSYVKLPEGRQSTNNYPSIIPGNGETNAFFDDLLPMHWIQWLLAVLNCPKE